MPDRSDERYTTLGRLAELARQGLDSYVACPSDNWTGVGAKQLRRLKTG